MPDSSLAAFLRSTFSQRSRDLLCGSLKAPDGASLQKVLGKLNTEEKKCEHYTSGCLRTALTCSP
jgi:hypothetical protein